MSEAIVNSAAPNPDRREYYRARLPAGSILRVRAWKIPPGTPLAHPPKPSTEMKLDVRDISISGIGVNILPKNGQLPSLVASDRLRVELLYRDYEVLIEGRVRTPLSPTENGTANTGIHFQGRQTNYDFQRARFTLSSIMGAIQREELKSRQRATDAA